jgi:hypothetical protein
MDLSSDDSWEPEPCNLRDFCCEEGNEKCDNETSDTSCDPHNAHQGRAHFSYGCRSAETRVQQPDGCGGTLPIPMPDRVRPAQIDADYVATYSDFCNIKRPKQGMHGNQVNDLTPLQFLHICELHHAGSKEGKRCSSSKMELRGHDTGVGPSNCADCNHSVIFNMSQAHSLVELLNDLHTVGTIALTKDPYIQPHGISRIDVMDPAAFRRFNPLAHLQPHFSSSIPYFFVPYPDHRGASARTNPLT